MYTNFKRHFQMPQMLLLVSREVLEIFDKECLHNGVFCVCVNLVSLQKDESYFLINFLDGNTWKEFLCQRKRCIFVTATKCGSRIRTRQSHRLSLSNWKIDDYIRIW
jgi:hypothetical protein